MNSTSERDHRDGPGSTNEPSVGADAASSPPVRAVRTRDGADERRTEVGAAGVRDDRSNVQLPDRSMAAAFGRLDATVGDLRAAEVLLREQRSALSEGLAAATEHEHYATLLEFMSDAYFVTDTQAIIREANRAAGRLLGFARTYCIGKPLTAYLTPTAARSFQTRLQSLIADDAPRPQEWLLELRPRRRTNRLDVVMRVGVVRDRSGACVGLHWLVRDVSAERELRESLRALTSEVDQRVTQRTAQHDAAVRVMTQLADQHQRDYTTLTSRLARLSDEAADLLLQEPTLPPRVRALLSALAAD